MKEEKLELIKRYQRIYLIDICKKVGISKSNLYAGRVKEEAIDKVIEEIKKELKAVFGEI